MEEHTNEISSEKVPETNKTNNAMALLGFIFGVIAAFVYELIGIFPILALIFSIIGLTSFDSAKHKNKWMVTWGLILSIIYTLMYIRSSIMRQLA